MKNRYPGLRSFEEQDYSIFYGRDNESAKLASIIYDEKFVVLFGSSGVGKSSLLNTLYMKNPKLESYIPLKIRLQSFVDDDKKNSTDPLSIVIKELECLFTSKSIKFDTAKILYDNNSPKLWEYIKLAETTLKKNGMQSNIILVFDQFEEFFSLDADTQKDFSIQLSQILHEHSPIHILNWMAEKADEERTAEIFEWYSQVAAKVIFSIRSDKLYHLNSLVGNIPYILSSRMELKHFEKENALQAITEPAKMSGTFGSPKIEFDPSIPNQIVEAIINDNNQVDSSLLQVICFTIEEKIKSKPAVNSQDTYFLNKEEFDTEIQLSQVLESFYLNQTEKINNQQLTDFIRSVLEDHFIENGERIALSRLQLIKRLNNQEDLIDFLIDNRLIREEQVSAGTIKYELIHDKLVPIVQRRKEMREKLQKLSDSIKQEETKKNLRTRKISRLVAFMVCCLAASFFYYIAGISINDNLVKSGYEHYNANNHYQAYQDFNNLRKNYFILFKSHRADLRNFDQIVLYDISGGDQLVAVDENYVATHNSDNTIYIWQLGKKTVLNGEGSLILKRILPDAMNMIISADRKYIGFRNTSGSISVYGFEKDSLVEIPFSKVHLFSLGANPFVQKESISDFKMDFVHNSSWLAYIDDNLNFKLYDAANNKNPAYVFLTKKDEYFSKDVQNFFYCTPHSNLMLTKKAKKTTVKLWDMTTNPRKSTDSITKVKTIFTTSKPNQFAYLTESKELFNLYGFSTMNSELIATNVDSIIPVKNGSKVIILSKARLRVFDFDKGNYNLEFDKNNKFYNRLKRTKSNHDSEIRWSASGNKLFFVNNRVIVDLDIAQSFPMFGAIGDQPIMKSSSGETCIMSHDETKYAYVNSKGELVMRAIDTTAMQTKRWKIFSAGEANYLQSAYTLDQICIFSNSDRLFAYLMPGAEHDRLIIVDLVTGKEYAQNIPVKTIGKYFTERYIHVVSDFNKTGGIFFINNKVRNKKYYNYIFNPISEPKIK